MVRRIVSMPWLYHDIDRVLTEEDFAFLELGISLEEIISVVGVPNGYIGMNHLTPFYTLDNGRLYLTFYPLFSNFESLLSASIVYSDGSSKIVNLEYAKIAPFDDFNIDDELVGIWKYDFTHLDRFLIFNADGTGAERIGRGGSDRMFTWTTENGYLIMANGDVFREFRGNYSYFITDSNYGRTLHLTVLESGNTIGFYCVYTSYDRCCCMRVAQNYFFGTQLDENIE